MKNFILIIGLFILISCSPSKEELLIFDYEQTIGNTKTDLNLKFVKLEFVKDITSRDSLEFLRNYFNEKKTNKIKEFEYDITRDSLNNVINKLMVETMIDKHTKEIYQGNVDRMEEDIKRYREWIDIYNGDCKGTFLEEIYIKINKFEKNLDSILSKEYDVIYTIKNPMLNNVEQTISKKYYFNSKISKILKVSKDTIR